MPIYEFYCQQCHMIFSFFSRAVNTTKRPRCPRCETVHLERRISLFAFSRRKGEAESSDVPDGAAEKMERAMESLAHEAEGMSEEDPRLAARLMRKLSDAAGLKLNPGMEEAMRRMEAGEDPEKIDAELGDLFEGEEPFIEAAGKSSGTGKKSVPPARDDHLYEL